MRKIGILLCSPTVYEIMYPLVLKTARKVKKEAVKAHAIDMKIMWVSNYRCPITKSLNLTPVIQHPHDSMPIT